MTTDPNTEWDYDKLLCGIASLESERNKMKFSAALTKSEVGEEYSKLFELHAEALQHTIEFIEFNMRENGVVSPTETYLTMK